MVWAVTDRGEGVFVYGDAGPSDIGDTFAPSNDDIILLGVFFNNTGDSVISATGWSSSQDFTLIKTYPYSQGVIELWARRISGSPSTGRINMTLSNTNLCRVAILQIAGAKTDGTIPTVFGTSIVAEEYEPTSEMAIGTLPAFLSSSNLTLVVSGNIGGETVYSTPSGWSGHVEVGQNVQLAWKTSEDTSPTVAFSARGNYYNFAAIAVEVKEAAVVGATEQPYIKRFGGVPYIGNSGVF